MNCPCGKPLGKRQRMFCSIHCRNSANGRKTGGWNKKEWVVLECDFCGKTYKVVPCRKDTSRHCSRQCHNTAVSREWDHTGEKNPMWKGGIQTYRRFKKKACERCKTKKNLLVHHKDRNRYNNVIGNLETLCKSCHHKEHNRVRNFGVFYRPRPS